jgi:hypothetical protein
VLQNKPQLLNSIILDYVSSMKKIDFQFMILQLTERQQIINTVNVVLIIIDRGVPRPVLRFCFKVFPLEVSAISTFTLELATSYGLMDYPSTEGQNASYTTLYPFTLFRKIFIISLQAGKVCRFSITSWPYVPVLT